MTDMGTFRTDVELENVARTGERVRLGDVLVDTGAELSWFPSTTLGEPGDLVILGARSLEGLNVHVDPVLQVLVDAGPAPAAVAA